MSTSENTVVRRYTAAARANHWLTAICLILLAISGLSLFYPSFFFLTVWVYEISCWGRFWT